MDKGVYRLLLVVPLLFNNVANVPSETFLGNLGNDISKALICVNSVLPFCVSFLQEPVYACRGSSKKCIPKAIFEK